MYVWQWQGKGAQGECTEDQQDRMEAEEGLTLGREWQWECKEVDGLVGNRVIRHSSEIL